MSFIFSRAKYILTVESDQCMHYSINCCNKPVHISKEQVEDQLGRFGRCVIKCSACRSAWIYDKDKDKFVKERDEKLRSANPPPVPTSGGGKLRPTVPAITPDLLRKNKISIPIDAEKVQELAFKLSQSGKSHDDFVWLYAEAELRLQPAYVTGAIYKDGDEGKIVEINRFSIDDQPSEDEIRTLAQEIAMQKLSDQKLHWYIAERNYIFEQAK